MTAPDFDVGRLASARHGTVSSAGSESPSPSSGTADYAIRGRKGKIPSYRSNRQRDEADEKELPIVAKRFLITEANRLVEENQHLKQFKDKYHDVDKRLAALKETLKPLRTNEFLSSVCLATG